MFKSNNGQDKADTHLETVIGAESSFQGTLRSKGSVRIDGKIEGGVSAEGVILGERGGSERQAERESRGRNAERDTGANGHSWSSLLGNRF